jgi:hypothetical protein
MTRKQVHEILGLEKSWLVGGLSAKYGPGGLAPGTMSESYELRPLRLVDLYAGPDNPESAMGSFILTSAVAIRLQFDADNPSWGAFGSSEVFQVPRAANPRVTPGYPRGVWGEREEASARLIGASFVINNTVIAELPDSPAFDPSPPFPPSSPP